MTWEAVSAVASAFAAFFALLAIRQANQIRESEARSAAYSSIVLAPIETAIQRFVINAEGVLKDGQGRVAQIVSSGMMKESQVTSELRYLADAYSRLWMDLERIVSRSLIVWDDPTLRRDLQLSLEDLQDLVLVQVSRLGSEPGYEFTPLIDRCCANVNKRLWDEHPSLKEARLSGIRKWFR